MNFFKAWNVQSVISCWISFLIIVLSAKGIQNGDVEGEENSSNP